MTTGLKPLKNWAREGGDFCCNADSVLFSLSRDMTGTNRVTQFVNQTQTQKKKNNKQKTGKLVPAVVDQPLLLPLYSCNDNLFSISLRNRFNRKRIPSFFLSVERKSPIDVAG